eukprot:Clim_evm20s252 gene=Clim_evmTU20s252
MFIFDEFKSENRVITQDDVGRARQIVVTRFDRPHMRAFHYSWTAFFIAFTSWFAFAPVMPTVKDTLGISKDEVKDSNIAAVSATIVVRVLIGPLCDKFGPRRVMACLMIAGAIPVFLSGLVNSATDLVVVRFFIGILGGTFVPCQFWTSLMFSSNVVGQANAMVGGWGNLGGGATYLIMPGILLVMEAAGLGEDKAWRYAMIVPATVLVTWAIMVLVFSDDIPQGKYMRPAKVKKMLEARSSISSLAKKDDGRDAYKDSIVSADVESVNTSPDSTTGAVDHIKDSAEKKSFMSLRQMGRVLIKPTVWFLIIHYATCFGVELAVNNTLATYFHEDFNKDNCVPDEEGEGCETFTKSQAALIGSLFGLMNLFARALGGFLSDRFFKKWYLSGRMWVQFLTIAGEGIMLIVFAQMTDPVASICTLVIFSVFVQASEGSTFALVPYVDEFAIGTVSGLVGAGGNLGALSWSTLFRGVDEQRQGYEYVGFIVLGSAILFTPFMRIQGTGFFDPWTRKNFDQATIEARQRDQYRDSLVTDDQLPSPSGDRALARDATKAAVLAADRDVVA